MLSLGTFDAFPLEGTPDQQLVQQRALTSGRRYVSDWPHVPRLLLVRGPRLPRLEAWVVALQRSLLGLEGDPLLGAHPERATAVLDLGRVRRLARLVDLAIDAGVAQLRQGAPWGTDWSRTR